MGVYVGDVIILLAVHSIFLRFGEPTGLCKRIGQVDGPVDNGRAL